MAHRYEETQVRELIEQRFPDLVVRHIARVGGGHDCDAFLVNGVTLFKFPRHRRASDNLQRETCVLAALQDRLPVQVPAITFEGQPSEGFPLYFCGYNAIEGVPLSPALLRRLSAGQQEQVAVDLARFLQALHTVALPHNSRVQDVQMRSTYEEHYREVMAILRSERPDARHVAERFFEEILRDEELLVHECRLAHNDFSSDHILCNPATGTVCGIIDFGDVAETDPDNDFLYLLEDGEEYGRAFGLRVLQHYGHPDPARVLKKFHMRERYWPFEKLLYGREYNNNDWYREALDEIAALRW